MNEEIVPLYPWVLIKPDEVKTKTDSSIILPDTAVKQPQMGTVITSTDEELVPNGSKVLWKELTGTYADEYILVDINDILCLLHPVE